MSKTAVNVHTLERHELSAIFGDMPREDFDSLVASIRRDGLMDATIKLLDGKVLDGWHRVRACKELDVLHCLDFEHWDDVSDGDPKAFVLARNIERRHLTPAQRAQIAVSFNERFSQGVDPRSLKASNDAFKSENKSQKSVPKTREELAEEAKVGRATIDRAIQVEKAGEAESVISGEKSVSEALLESNRHKAQAAEAEMWKAFEKSELSTHMDKDAFVKEASKAVQCPSEWSDPRHMQKPEFWIVRFESIKKALEQESGWVQALFDGFREVVEAGDLDAAAAPKTLPSRLFVPTQPLLKDLNAFVDQHGEKAIDVIVLEEWTSRHDVHEVLVKTILNNMYQDRFGKKAYDEEPDQRPLIPVKAAVEDPSSLPDKCVIDGYDIRVITITMKWTDSNMFEVYKFGVKTSMPSADSIPISIIPDDTLKVLITLATEHHRDVKVKEGRQ